MAKVKIYGAGSIGNHLAHSCRSKGWDVLMCDKDPEALKRTEQEIYPSRYGTWDGKIRLASKDPLNESFDLVIVGTPPDSHVPLALNNLRDNPPKAILIEKPLCPPSLEACAELRKQSSQTGTFVAVGYNHTLTQNSKEAADILKQKWIGEAQTLTAQFREHWGGIYAAHPWLKGPEDTYLGFSDRGGGASGEHSHAINIWQHFARLLNLGRIIEVSAVLDTVSEGKASYDRVCLASVKTDKGFVGHIAQDVVTKPALKTLRVQGKNGFLEWFVNFEPNQDALLYSDTDGKIQKKIFQKTRPDDFKGEIEHMGEILEGKTKDSPIALDKGLETMLVLRAIHESHRLQKTVRIDYSVGPVPAAIC